MESFIILIAACIFVTLGVIWIKTYIENTRMPSYVGKAFTFAIIAFLFYIFFLFSQTVNEAILLKSLFYTSTTWLLYYDLLFTRYYTHYSKDSKVIDKIYYCFCLFDSLLCIINIPTHFMFSLVQKYSKPLNMIYWSIQSYTFHWIHFLICSLFILQTIGMLVYRIIKIPNGYKSNYFAFISSYSVIIILSVFAQLFDFPIDISSFLYGFMASNVFLYASSNAPRKIIYNSLNISLENSEIGICCFDEAKHLRFANKKCRSIFGIKKNYNQDALNIFLIDFIEKHRIGHKKSFVAEEEFSIDCEKHIFEITYKILTNYKSEIGIMLTFNDKTDIIKEYENERHIAEHDELTGLYNRDSFFEKATKIVREEPSAKWVMICTNIKDFKLINEINGDKAGDDLLKVLAKYLTNNIHEDSIYGRIVDDKFAALIRGKFFDKEKILTAVKAIAKTIKIEGFQFRINVGIYKTEFAMESALLMYDKARLALEHQTDSYLHTFAEYTPDLMNTIITEKNILSDFDFALSSGQFKMFLQPQIDKNGKIHGAEALSRWITPGAKPLPPSYFIPILEESGLIHRLDETIWEEAVKLIKQWENTSLNNLTISVNVSAKDFYYLDIYSKFVNLTKKYKISPSKIKIEITETFLLKNIKTCLKPLKKLQEKGFNIAIDDFGSKYSSLLMLKDMPLDILKVDMAFLQKSDDQKKEKIILKNIFEMAKMMKMQIIVEGVETQEQIDLLSPMQCDLFQGYYYSLPISVTDFEKKYL